MSQCSAYIEKWQKFKNTGIWVHRDLILKDRIRRKKLLEMKRRILEIDKEARVLVRNDYFLYQNKRFSWEEGSGFTAANEEDMVLINGYLTPEKRNEEQKNVK
uniref:Uncharacterized protein n=1 Tax=Rhodnius prolixus TaxID=13249 RepID=T1IFP6_RHOPR